VTSCLFGLCYGVVYSRFQTCIWLLLPSGINVANAMGFVAVAKVSGCGLSNFFAGFILDSFRIGANVDMAGYVTMSVFSTICILISVVILRDIQNEQLYGPSYRQHSLSLC